jgi:ABC-2 type transport system permease protein
VNELWLVAAREIRTRIATKGFLASLALSAVLVAALTFVPKFFSGPDSFDVGVVGAQPAPIAQVEFTTYPDEAAATTAILDGDVDAALSGGKILADGEPSQRLALLLESAHHAAQIKAAGVTLTPLTVVNVGADTRYDEARTGIAIVLVMLLFFLLLYSAIYVAMGVVEEKGSRIVEILLAAVRPWQLLGGKIVGLGVLGFISLLAVIAAGLAGALVSGGVELPPGMTGIVVSAVAWFILGYAFFSSLAAALGALVSRQEDLNSVLSPLTMLMTLTYLVAYFAAVEPTGTVARVLSIVPPFSAMVMPVRTAASDVPLLEIAASVVLMLAAVVGMVLLGARIYERAVLRTGARLKITEVLRGR